jgi:hypothetical protein
MKKLHAVVGTLALALVGCGETLSEEQLVAEREAGEPAGDVLAQARQEMVSVALNIGYTDDSWTFLKNRNNDLIGVKKWATGSGKTEVHILSAASNYQTYTTQIPTAQHMLDSNWDVEGDADGNLYMIRKWGGASGKTEVHTLSAASNYQSFTAHAPTALGYTDSTWDFEVGANGDVFGIRKSGTNSGTTEIHVLSKSSSYGGFLFQTPTALHETGDEFRFVVDYTTNDVWAVKRYNTGSGRTELHVIESASSYRRMSLQVPTSFGPTDNTADWSFSSNGSLTGVLKQNTGSGRSESHTYSLPRPTTQCGVQLTSAAGGNDAYKGYVQLGAQSGQLAITFDTYSVKDRIVLRKDGVAIFDSGCVGLASSQVVAFSGPSTFANLEVYPNCAGTTSTGWEVTVGCP